jgi:hypothetical protein
LAETVSLNRFQPVTEDIGPHVEDDDDEEEAADVDKQKSFREFFYANLRKLNLF